MLIKERSLEKQKPVFVLNEYFTTPPSPAWTTAPGVTATTSGGVLNVVRTGSGPLWTAQSFTLTAGVTYTFSFDFTLGCAGIFEAGLLLGTTPPPLFTPLVLVSGQNSFTFTPTTSGTYTLVVRRKPPLAGACSFTLDNVKIYSLVASSDYRYGFQSQEKDDEMKGEGNSYTAEYWQYDSRLGRRWNVDPIYQPWQSTYCAFNNNPIYYTDPQGLSGEGPKKDNVKKGEGAYSVAKRNNITTDELVKFNPTVFPEGLKSGTYMLHPGQQLIVSDPNASSETPTHSYVKAPKKTLKINPLPETTTKTVQKTITHSSNTTAGVLATGGVLIADDATGIGVLDDPLLILVGVAAIGTLIYDYANTYDEVVDVPITVPVDANATKITLYRGVSSNHPDYVNAQMGTATPWGLNGGHGDPEAHSGGNTFSIFTSWSLSKEVANRYATQNGACGVVLTKSFYILETVPSGEFFDEWEVLVPGIVTGATVTPTAPAKK